MSVAVMVDIKLAQLWKKVVGKVNSKLYSLASLCKLFWNAATDQSELSILC